MRERVARLLCRRDPILSPVGMVVLQLGIAVQAIFRGTDYISTPKLPDNYVMGVVARAAPLEVWALGLLVAGSLVMVGMWIDRLPVVPLGHILLMAEYVALGIGALIDSQTDTVPGGYRSGTAFIIAALFHLVFAHGTWNVWRRKVGV